MYFDKKDMILQIVIAEVKHSQLRTWIKFFYLIPNDNIYGLICVMP